jgi:hypothetical protein
MPVERTAGGTSLIDVLDRVLDKGIVIDAWVRVSLVGIDLITVEARVVVASIDTYLKYSEAVGRWRPSRARWTPRARRKRSWQRTPRSARSSATERGGARAPPGPPPALAAVRAERTGGRVSEGTASAPRGAMSAAARSFDGLAEAKLGLLEFLIVWDDPREVAARSVEWLLECGGARCAACFSVELGGQPHGAAERARLRARGRGRRARDRPRRPQAPAGGGRRTA